MVFYYKVFKHSVVGKRYRQLYRSGHTGDELLRGRKLVTAILPTLAAGEERAGLDDPRMSGVRHTLALQDVYGAGGPSLWLLSLGTPGPSESLHPALACMHV